MVVVAGPSRATIMPTLAQSTGFSHRAECGNWRRLFFSQSFDVESASNIVHCISSNYFSELFDVFMAFHFDKM